ncbi:MAG: 4a-hydroxytetrahydrobiopterin dehydratase [Candidatus Sericytochromatia bacterium]|nr:MAG: 4a-hydroxytetrahydrobiopterin dehydratase [Candidatus Sericytochromatia bacterium]
MKKLSEEEIRKYLKSLEGWEYKNNFIEKNFVFNDFKEAMFFINAVAFFAEKENHHPDINIVYNKVRLILNTHTENNVTMKDINLAKIINNI